MAKEVSKRSYKDLITTFSPAILLVIAGFWVAYQFVAPPPPKKITISTGSKTGNYFKVAQQYREALAKEGIELEIINSSGSGENINRLLNNEVDLAFVQGGTGKEGDSLQSIGSLYYEPLWIFIRKELNAEKITDLSNRRLVIGQDGSGTQILAKELLDLNRIDNKAANLLTISSSDAAEAISSAEIDAVFIVSSANSETVQKLLHNDQLELMGLLRADTYVKLLPYLSKVTLPEGIIDLANNFPAQADTLLAPTANLVVAEGFNSSLIVLLLRAADEIHSKGSIFSAPETFPSDEFTAYPINDVAKRYYKVGSPFLMRYLPFWPAVFIDRMIVMLIPLIMLMIPLSKIMPPLYQWRIRSSIYRWYKELQEVSDEVSEQAISEEQLDALNSKLTMIENEVNKVKPPLSYVDQLYNLLLHIDLVRKKLNTVK